MRVLSVAAGAAAALLLGLLQARAQSLIIAEVEAPAINCVFHPACAFTVDDSASFIPLARRRGADDDDLGADLQQGQPAALQREGPRAGALNGGAACTLSPLPRARATPNAWRCRALSTKRGASCTPWSPRTYRI
jgi:hypothetical protein